MSGGNCPETPRQKMIGMMYLMLTAMLALNVSGDLLNAFFLVDQSIKDSTKTVEQKNRLLYYNFDAANAQNPAKVKEKYDKALEVQARADTLYNLIQGYKVLMVHTADGPEYTPEEYLSASNQDVAAQVMMVEKGGDRAKELKAAMAEYRDFLKEIAIAENDTTLASNVEHMLSTEDPPRAEDGEQKTWEAQVFEHLPLAASMALMSNLQGCVRNTQADIVTCLYNSIDKASFKFNQLAPIILAPSSYVLRGGQYTADIMLAAYDDRSEPIVTVNGEKLPIEDGKGKYVVPASSVGQKKYSAKLEFPDPITGELKPYYVEGEYEVGEPQAVVSAAKMNVCYIGVDNPLEISASGVSASDLKVTATGGQIKKQGEYYIFRPDNNAVKAKISVSADQGGKVQRLGEKEFRVKKVPDPVAVVGGLSGGKIKQSLLRAQGGVFAEMKDFDFDLEFKISKFTLSYVKGGFLQELSAESAAFTPQQKEMIKGFSRGTKFYIEGIEAVGPGGRRKLGSLIFTVD